MSPYIRMDKYTRHINKLVKAALDEAPNYDKLLTPEVIGNCIHLKVSPGMAVVH